MAVNMYLIHPKDDENEAEREKIINLIDAVQGFILMATSAGSILAAFDECYLERIKACDAVSFASGVSLNPDAPGAMALQTKFAENIALQLAGRPGFQGVDTQGSIQTEGLPPGYKPLTWRVPPDERWKL